MLAEIYADLFDYPLTPSEARLWAIHLPSQPRHIKFTPRNLTSLRRQREKYAMVKSTIAVRASQRLSKIPTVAAVFLTGSVAAGNAKKGADVDLMVVTYPHTLWLTRLFIFSYLKITRQLKNPICPNIFLDTDHLNITQQNLYTAHEILQSQCLFDRGGVESFWLKNNAWTKKYLPNAYRSKFSRDTTFLPKTQFQILLPFELIVFVFQYLYMKPKKTNERLGLGFAFFHPRDLSTEILAKFNSRLEGV